MGYPMNFTVFLHRRKRRSKGRTGIVRIPDENIANLLILHSYHLPPICGARIKLARSKNEVDPRDIETLRKSPYRDPEILREQNALMELLADREPLTKLQFGWLDRDQVFSPEWTRSYGVSMSASVTLDGGRRDLRIEEDFDSYDFDDYDFDGSYVMYKSRRVVIRFGNVGTLSYSRNGDPDCSLLFTLLAPPVFEEPIPYLAAFALEWDEPKDRRTRHSSLCDDGLHARLVPYTSYAILLTVANKNSRQNILDMCSAVHLPKPTRFPAAPEARGHFAAKTLAEAEQFIAALPWPIAFQVLSLLRNVKLSAKELLHLRDEIEIMVLQYHSMPKRAADIIVQFGLELDELEWLYPSHNSSHQILESLRQCFRIACGTPSSSFRLREPLGDLFTCYHVAVTPTSEIPEGPYPDRASFSLYHLL